MPVEEYFRQQFPRLEPPPPRKVFNAAAFIEEVLPPAAKERRRRALAGEFFWEHEDEGPSDAMTPADKATLTSSVNGVEAENEHDEGHNKAESI